MIKTHNSKENKVDKKKELDDEASKKNEESVEKTKEIEQKKEAAEEKFKELVAFIEKLKNENEELKNKENAWKHKCAELTNQLEFNKKYTADVVRYSNKRLIEELLVFLDTYKNALQLNRSKKEGVNPESKSILEGFEMVSVEFWKILAGQGVSLIKITPHEDFFDADSHQVLELKEDKNYSNNIILEVVRDGYLIHNRVLRPALVNLNKLNEEGKKE